MKIKSLVTLSILVLCLRTVAADRCRGPANWDGRRCICPNGMINLNGKCVCDYGYWPSGSECAKCDNNNQFNGQSCNGCATNIPDGYLWNGFTIIQNWAMNYCGADSYWNGFYCQPINNAISCQPGFFWKDGCCIRFGRTTCSNTQYWNGRRCVPIVVPPVCFNQNFYWDSSQNACVYRSTRQVQCPPGRYYFNGSMCVGITSNPTCSPGYFFNGQTCIRFDSLNNGDGVRCIQNYFWNGRICIDGSKNGKNCDGDYYYDQASNMCIMLRCKDGQKLDRVNRLCSAAEIISTAASINTTNIMNTMKSNFDSTYKNSLSADYFNRSLSGSTDLKQKMDDIRNRFNQSRGTMLGQGVQLRVAPPASAVAIVPAPVASTTTVSSTEVSATTTVMPTSSQVVRETLTSPAQVTHTAPQGFVQTPALATVSPPTVTSVVNVASPQAAAPSQTVAVTSQNPTQTASATVTTNPSSVSVDVTNSMAGLPTQTYNSAGNGIGGSADSMIAGNSYSGATYASIRSGGMGIGTGGLGSGFGSSMSGSSIGGTAVGIGASSGSGGVNLSNQMLGVGMSAIGGSSMASPTSMVTPSGSITTTGSANEGGLAVAGANSMAIARPGQTAIAQGNDVTAMNFGNLRSAFVSRKSDSRSRPARDFSDFNFNF